VCRESCYLSVIKLLMFIDREKKVETRKCLGYPDVFTDKFPEGLLPIVASIIIESFSSENIISKQTYEL